MNHIERIHPRKRGTKEEKVKFNLCESLGSLDVFTCCTKNKKITDMS